MAVVCWGVSCNMDVTDRGNDGGAGDKGKLYSESGGKRLPLQAGTDADGELGGAAW